MGVGGGGGGDVSHRRLQTRQTMARNELNLLPGTVQIDIFPIPPSFSHAAREGSVIGCQGHVVTFLHAATQLIVAGEGRYGHGLKGMLTSPGHNVTLHHKLSRMSPFFRFSDFDIDEKQLQFRFLMVLKSCKSGNFKECCGL